jgi:hypothetical protein
VANRNSPSPLFSGRLIPKVGNAVAASMSIGFEEGLKRIEALGASGALDQYYQFQPARVVILRHMSCQPSPSQATALCKRLGAYSPLPVAAGLVSGIGSVANKSSATICGSMNELITSTSRVVGTFLQQNRIEYTNDHRAD